MAQLTKLVSDTGFWDWQPHQPWRLSLKVQVGMPNAWIGSPADPSRKRGGHIQVCVTLCPDWEHLVHAHGCAVVDRAFLLGVEWVTDENGLEVDLVGKCTYAVLSESRYFDARRIVNLHEGFVCGHGGVFSVGDNVRVAVGRTVEKWERGMGIGPEKVDTTDLPF